MNIEIPKNTKMDWNIPLEPERQVLGILDF